MELENEDGQEVSGSPSDEGNGSEAGGSPTPNDSNSESSSEEEEQSSLDALNEALTGADGEDKETSEKQDDEPGDDKPKGEEEPGEEEAEKKKGDESSEKPTDEELLKPLPENTPEKTAERFEKLTEGYKNLKDQFEAQSSEKAELQQYRDDVSNLIQHSGATPDEFKELIEYSHLVKSGNLDGALAVLDSQRASLAKAMGKTLPGVDLFSEHPDLQEQINSHEITETAAAELVKARNIETMRLQQEQKLREQQEANQSKQQNSEQFNAKIEAATQEVMSMVGKWEKNDINFSHKQSIIMKKVEEIGQRYQPEQWAEVVQLTYDAIKVDTKKPSTTSHPSPLRPGGGGSDNTKVAASSFDALSQALGKGS